MKAWAGVTHSQMGSCGMVMGTQSITGPVAVAHWQPSQHLQPPHTPTAVPNPQGWQSKAGEITSADAAQAATCAGTMGQQAHKGRKVPWGQLQANNATMVMFEKDGNKAQDHVSDTYLGSASQPG